MSVLMTHAAWVLVVAFALSLAYEVWRVTAKAGTSRHDSRAAFVRTLPLYVAAVAVISGLFTGDRWAAWLGLAFSVVLILVSVLYYNQRIMIERQPGLIDWVEDLVYTGLLFVAAALLLYEVTGATLRSV